MNKFNICPNDYSGNPASNNDMIVEASGSGKTMDYVISAMRSITGSPAVADTKGQLDGNCTNQLEDNVYTNDLVSPLRAIRRYADGRYREQDVLTLANTIMPSLDSRDPFWEKAAADYIAFLIAYCLETLNPEEQTMISVCELHGAFNQPNGRASFELRLSDKEDSFAAKQYRRIKSSLNCDKMWGSINEFVKRALERYSSDNSTRLASSAADYEF